MPPSIRQMQNRFGDKVHDAYDLAAAVHEGQKRKSGEPYITHPLAVAELLFSIGADQDVIYAALLHDALEEGENRMQIEHDIHSRFGDHVLYLVHAVSKDGRITDSLEKQSAYMEQITHALELDIFVFFIKVADLIHNMSTISALHPNMQAQWIRELKYDYMPLFAEFYHRIPTHYRDMYHHLLDAVQAVIDAYDKQAATRRV